MIDRTDCINKLRSCRNVVTERFGVHSMRLFGSVARDEQKESSDVDVCVEMTPSLLKRSGLKIYLEELLSCKVDVLRIHKNMDGYLLNQIKRDGVPIFEWKKYGSAYPWQDRWGVRDVIAHHYFDIDANEIFSILNNNLDTVKDAVAFFKKELQRYHSI